MIAFSRRRIAALVVGTLVVTAGVATRLHQEPAGERRPEVAASEPPAFPDPTLPGAEPPPSVSPGPSTALTPARPRPTRPDRLASSGTSSLSPPPASVTTPQTAELDDLLEPDGQPPEGVAAQLDFFLGGGPECMPAESAPRPRLRVRPVVEVPSIPTVCFEGFGEFREMTAVLTGPGGATSTRSGRFDELEGVTFPFVTGARTGRYRVTATAGRRSASATFEVRRATKPRMWINPDTAEWGETIDVHIGGFPPRRPADLHLYVCGPLQYRSTTTVAVDGRGEAHLAIRTPDPGPRPTECFAMNSPLIFIPADPPIPLHGPPNSVFHLQTAWEPDPPTGDCSLRQARC